jgi:hypothetical protein
MEFIKIYYLKWSQKDAFVHLACFFINNITVTCAYFYWAEFSWAEFYWAECSGTEFYWSESDANQSG